MAKKVKYTCEDTRDTPWVEGRPCREFQPSVRDARTQEEANAFTEECESLVDDEEAFRRRGCRRKAHYMVPMGREGLAGKQIPENFSALEQKYMGEIDRRVTPYDRRTQSRIPRRIPLQDELFEILSKMQREQNGVYRGEAGLRAFEEALQYAIPRRVEAFVYRFRQNGKLSFLLESTARIQPMQENLRALALLTALTNVGGSYIRPISSMGVERFGTMRGGALYFALKVKNGRDKRLRAVQVKGGRGVEVNTDVVGKACQGSTRM